MAKLTKQEISDLKKIGIETKTGTDVEARKILIKFLHENEVDGVDNDSLSDLIGMAEVFYEPDTNKTIENELEEDGLDELAEEVVKTTPVKKSVVTSITKSTVKTKSVPINGEKFDARNNKKHMAMLQVFLKTFPEENFQIDALKQGFTVRLLGDNGKTTILNFDELKINNDGELIGNLYTNRFKSADDVTPFLPENIQNKEIGMYRGESHPSIRCITQSEFFEIINGSEGFLEETLKRAAGKDVTMGINRKKLEAALTESKTIAKKTPIAKKTSIEEESELELESELEPELEDDVIADTSPIAKKPVKKTKKTIKKK